MYFITLLKEWLRRRLNLLIKTKSKCQTFIVARERRKESLDFTRFYFYIAPGSVLLMFIEILWFFTWVMGEVGRSGRTFVTWIRFEMRKETDVIGILLFKDISEEIPSKFTSNRKLSKLKTFKNTQPVTLSPPQKIHKSLNVIFIIF